MRYLLLFMFLVGIFVLGGRFCNFNFGGVRGEGPVRTETRNLPAFHSVTVDLAGDVELIVSPETRAEIQAQENLLPILKTEVLDGKLRIYFEKSVWFQDEIRIKLYAPAFDDLALRGSGALVGRDSLSGARLDLLLSGSGNIELPNLHFGQVVCTLSGSGNVNAGGDTDALEVTLAGSGDIELKHLRAKQVKATLSGSGEIRCFALEGLDAKVSGSGDIYYAGNPAALKTNISGSGEIKQDGAEAQ